MLGLLKPNQALSLDQTLLYQRAHCSTCKAVQKLSLTAPLGLSREASFLTLFAVMMSDRELETSQSRCSAVPIIKRKTFVLSKELSDLCSAFSIIAANAQLEDHRKDGERAILRWILRPTQQPHLAWALSVFGLSEAELDSLSDAIEVSDNIQSYLDAHTAVRDVWMLAFVKSLELVGSSEVLIDPEIKLLLKGLSRSLSDLMILKDAIEDEQEDQVKGKLNPVTKLNRPHAEALVREAQAIISNILNQLHRIHRPSKQSQDALQALLACITPTAQSLSESSGQLSYSAVIRTSAKM